jgi:hypothetical protein
MIELLYVDHERLRSYAEQTGGRSRRVLSYSGTFGLSGPSVGVTSTRPELSKVHEQLDAVRKYLAHEKLVAYWPPRSHDPTFLKETFLEARGEPLLFREETRELQSIYVPPSGNHPLLKDGLSLWFSGPSIYSGLGLLGLLVLIEQFPLPDEPSVRTLTGYTLLALLSDDFRFVSLPDEFELPDDYRLYVAEDGERKYAVLTDGLTLPKVPEMGVDTRQALKMLGARIGPPKNATVLYRVRATFMERHRDSVTTVGYPIAIWRPELAQIKARVSWRARWRRGRTAD